MTELNAPVFPAVLLRCAARRTRDGHQTGLRLQQQFMCRALIEAECRKHAADAGAGGRGSARARAHRRPQGRVRPGRHARPAALAAEDGLPVERRTGMEDPHRTGGGHRTGVHSPLVL